jgi:hypothetical protein
MGRTFAVMIIPRPLGTRRSHRPSWKLTLPLALAAIMAAACSSGPDAKTQDNASPSASSEPPAPSPARTQATTTPGPSTEPPLGETPIKVSFGDTVLTARLADNATAQDLADQLPLTLTFKDFNKVEKIAKLPRPLSMQGVPKGDDPDISDIGYYQPSGDLVFYYGDVGYWNGIVRIGQFDNTMELIEQQDHDFRVTIERTDRAQ